MGLCATCEKAPAVVTILKCDFCGRDQRHVPLLVKGPFGSDICSECVEDAAAVIEERRTEANEKAMAENTPSPTTPKGEA